MLEPSSDERTNRADLANQTGCDDFDQTDLV
jgi:hypothetical protein